MSHKWRRFTSKINIRYLLVIVSAVFVIATFTPVFWSLWKLYSHFFPGVEAIKLTESVRIAVEKRLDFSASMFQIGILLLAGMWGLVFAEKDRTYSILSEWPEITMLILATIALSSSFVGHFVFVWDMTSLLKSDTQFSGLIPDIDSIDVSYALFSQILSLSGGAIIVATCVASGRWLKEPVTTSGANFQAS